MIGRHSRRPEGRGADGSSGGRQAGWVAGHLARWVAGHLARWRGDLLGAGSVVAAAAAYLSPALKDGARFGSFDFVIPLTSLGAGAYPQPPFNHLNSDVVSQMNAWNAVDWQQVHAGHFPLWNDQSLLGLPHFLNFESAVLSLPDLVSYAVPLRFAFFVAVIVKLLIAGLGAYTCARVLRCGPLGASFAGITFMLSGAFANWLSWPLTDVVGWLGWIVAFAVLCYRSPGRMRYAAGLVLSVAWCAYGGFPEGNIFVLASLLLLALVWALGTRLLGARFGPHPLAGMGTIAGASVIGLALALPLWWPGLQVLDLAHRRTEGGFPGIPAKGLALLIAQGYDGLPTHASTPFLLHGWNYYETASYLGVVALALAAVGLWAGRRRPVVLALGALCVVGVLISYSLPSVHPIQTVLNHVAGEVQWERFRTVLGLPAGILGGIGLERLLRSRERSDVAVFAGATGVLTVVVIVMATRIGSGATASTRERSLIWPIVLLALSLVVMGVWWLAPRLSWSAAGALWAASGAFLLFAGVGINSYSHTFYPVTPAIAQLQKIVGHSLVGLDTGARPRPSVQTFTPVGFYPNVNLGYGVSEFAGHDPVLPQEYFDALGGGVQGGPGFFEPDIDSVALARKYGTPYVLAAPGAPPLRGAVPVKKIAGEALYWVAGAARFTVADSEPVSISFTGTEPGGRVESVSQPSASEYDVVTRSPTPTVLTARITAVPGWHATVNGRPTALTKSGVMWTLRVPAGTARVRIWYWPDRLSEGLAGAGAGCVAFALWASVASIRRRRA